MATGGIARTFLAEDGQEQAVQEYLSDALEALGCPRKSAHALRLALEELFVNVAHYAYAPGSGTVDISITPDGDGRGIVLELRDTGAAFDPFGHDDPQAPGSVASLNVGGLGIMLVRKLMDSYTYERIGAVNVVRIGKRWEDE